MSNEAEPRDKTYGQGAYIVEDGDSIDSIAEIHGHFWQTIWDLPENAALKAAREDRTILMPGDKVTIPALREKQEKRATDLVHRFKRKGVPARIIFAAAHQDGTVYADCAYRLKIGKRTYEGRTDAEGRVEVFVAPSARVGLLKLDVDIPGYESKPEWRLRIGTLYPLETIKGIQQRLNNLGYDCGEEDGDFGDRTKRALRAFQAAMGLDRTDAPDEPTRDALDTAHGG